MTTENERLSHILVPAGGLLTLCGLDATKHDGHPESFSRDGDPTGPVVGPEHLASCVPCLRAALRMAESRHAVLLAGFNALHPPAPASPAPSEEAPARCHCGDPMRLGGHRWDGGPCVNELLGAPSSVTPAHVYGSRCTGGRCGACGGWHCMACIRPGATTPADLWDCPGPARAPSSEAGTRGEGER